MIRLWISLSVFRLVLGVYGADCDFKPLSLPLTDVQILPDVKESLVRGIPATIGSPAQDIVLLPWSELNNTFIYDQEGLCDSTIIWNDKICTVRRGNLFDPSESDDYSTAKDLPEAGGATEENGHEGSEKGINKLLSNSIAAKETLTLGDESAVEDFAFGIPRFRWDHGYTLLHSLGMGRNSTYLNALKKSGAISARVWSIFWGRMWVDEPLDGSVVIGGYDSSKVTGDNDTKTLDYTDWGGSGCWTGMKVIVRDIQINHRDGGDQSIMPSNTALPFCITPHKQLLMEAPAEMVDRFEEVADIERTGESFGVHWSAQTYNSSNFFDGDMTIYLDSGLDIRIPNSQFMTPHVDVNRSGKRFFDKSKRELLINPVGKQPATLGRYFLTAAYLMVNHDANSFTLWKANPTSSSDLIPVYDEEAAERCDSSVPGVVQPSASASSDPDGDEDYDEGDNIDDGDSGPSAGLIGGAVGGSLGGLAIIGSIAAFLLIRRRRKRDAAGNVASGDGATAPSYPSAQNYDQYYKPANYDTRPGEVHEVHGSLPTMSEAVGDNAMRYELDTGMNYGRRL